MMLLGCVASQTAGDVPATGYPLDDDGTNAASFNAVLLPTQSPAYNRALYQLTATEQTAVAMPAVINAAPGLVSLTDGVPRVCGFIINAVPGPGTIRGFFFQIYNLGGSGSVLVHASVAKDEDATTGTIQGQAGSFPPSVSNFGSAFTGELTGAKVAIQLTLTGGGLSGKLWVNGTLMGTSTPIATDGGVIALLNVSDGEGAGQTLDIAAVPLATLLADGYGTFDTGAIDMIDNVIP